MTPHGEAVACDPVQALGAADRVVDRRRPQRLYVSQKSLSIPRRHVTVEPGNSHHPAIALERQHQAATVVLGHLAEGHDALPIGRGVVRDAKYACGIAEIDTNSALLGKWSTDRLQQSESGAAPSRGIDNEVRRNYLARAAIVLAAHTRDFRSICQHQHFLDPAALPQRGGCAAFNALSHGALDRRPGYRITRPAEIALREGIVTRAFDANIEAGPERHGSRPREIMFESGEEFVEGALAAKQKPV